MLTIDNDTLRRIRRLVDRNQDKILAKIDFYNEKLKKKRNIYIRRQFRYKYLVRLAKYFERILKTYRIKFEAYKKLQDGGRKSGAAGADSADISAGGTITTYLLPAIFKQNSKKFQHFVDYFMEFLEHEFVHKEQMRLARLKTSGKIYKSDFMKTVTEKGCTDKYLSDKHELLAFSFQIMKEFSHMGLSKEEIMHVINHPVAESSKSFIKDSMLSDYVSSFGMNHPIAKRLYRKLYELASTMKE
jgi:hypothetical protein